MWLRRSQRPFSEEDKGLKEEQTEVQGSHGNNSDGFWDTGDREPLPLVMLDSRHLEPWGQSPSERGSW